MSLLQQLHDLLQKDPRNFFPNPFATMSPQLGALPLLKLLNDPSVLAPKFPLSTAAIEQLTNAPSAEELNTLNSQLLRFIRSNNPTTIDLKAIFSNLEGLADQIAHQAVALLSNQIVIGASLLSIVTALDPMNLDSVFGAQSEYFFGHLVNPTDPSQGTASGYVTVAGEVIAPPALPTLGSVADLKDVGNLFSRKTGEQYVRDLTRVGFEALANNVWKLESRYDQIGRNAKLKSGDPKFDLKINDPNKAQNWFKGFADYAESGVTSAVEQALSQGGGPVQANPLLAARIATAAGTAARKGSQHVFLEEIGIAL